MNGTTEIFSTICKFAKYLRNQVWQVLFQYAIFVSFLSFLASVCPSLYTWSTKWANQETLPYIKKCHIQKSENPIKFKQQSKYKWYDIRISLGGISGNKYDILIEPKSDSISISNFQNIEDLPLNPDLPNFIYIKDNSILTLEHSFKALTTEKSDSLSQYTKNKHSLSENDCPFSVQILGIKK